MRITGGLFKNHPLTAPKTIRPTSEKLRQAIFNICQHEIEGASFLDIFAGSGAMGIEALSRGAEKAVFIEKERLSLKAIKENVSRLKLESQSTILPGDALAVLKELAKSSASFDMIFVDPPYGLKLKGKDQTYGEAVLELIDQTSLLKESGLLFFEEREMPSAALHELKLEKERRFGDTLLLQYVFGSKKF